jgi:hypothetical protein
MIGKLLTTGTNQLVPRLLGQQQNVLKLVVFQKINYPQQPPIIHLDLSAVL